MTAKQKAAREKFKAVVKEASKLRKKNPKLTQSQAIKQAWAIDYSTKRKSAKKKIADVGRVKKSAPKKKAATKKAVSTHKDTKSHNVNIRVMSGVDKLHSDALHRYKEVLKDIKNYEDSIKRIKDGYYGMTSPEKMRAKIILKKFTQIKNELKTHSKELKKHI